MSDNTNSDIKAVRCCMRCLTANMYMLSEQGVGSLISKVRQTKGWVIEENFPRILAGLMSRAGSESASQSVVSSYSHAKEDLWDCGSNTIWA